MKLKREIEPADIAKIKDWAISIKVDNDIDSYDGDDYSQMAIALGILELIEEFEEMQNGRYSEY